MSVNRGTLIDVLPRQPTRWPTSASAIRLQRPRLVQRHPSSRTGRAANCRSGCPRQASRSLASPRTTPTPAHAHPLVQRLHSAIVRRQLPIDLRLAGRENDGIDAFVAAPLRRQPLDIARLCATTGCDSASSPLELAGLRHAQRGRAHRDDQLLKLDPRQKVLASACGPVSNVRLATTRPSTRSTRPSMCCRLARNG